MQALVHLLHYWPKESKLSKIVRVRMAYGVLLVSALALAGCAGSTGTSGESDGASLEDLKPITLTVGEPLSARSSNFQALQAFMDEVTEASDGKITFDVYTDSTLHTFPEGLSALNSGLSDITLYSPTLYAEEVPATLWATGLGVYTFGSTPQEMLAGSPAFVKTLLESADITQNLADNGVVMLTSWVSSPYSLLCTKPIRSLADAKGVIVASFGSPYTEEASALGMTNLYQPNPEVYQALQRGVVECNLAPIPSFMNDGLWEVAKYWTQLPFSSSVGTGYAISKQTWDSLPEVARDIIDDAKAAITANYLRISAEANKRWFDEAPGHGVEFIDASPDMINAIQDVQSERAENFASTAPDVISDPQDEIDSVKNYFDEWQSILADEFGIDQVSDSPERLTEALKSTADDVDWDQYQERLTKFLKEPK